MPNVLLPTPHFEQSNDGACLPACVRMVLAYWSDHRPEAEIGKLLGTKPFGTPVSNVIQLRQHGYRVEFGSMSVDQLRNHLASDQPVIARVWTAMLDYWQDAITSHVVVVVGFRDDGVYLNDPALATNAQIVSWDSFLAAWAEFDETAVVIHPV